MHQNVLETLEFALHFVIFHLSLKYVGLKNFVYVFLSVCIYGTRSYRGLLVAEVYLGSWFLCDHITVIIDMKHGDQITYRKFLYGLCVCMCLS